MQDGDLLLGPDGRPRRAFDLVSGRGPLYRIKISMKEDVVVSAEHILLLLREKKRPGTSIYSGPSVCENLHRFVEQFGEMEIPSSSPAAPDRPRILTKDCEDFFFFFFFFFASFWP